MARVVTMLLLQLIVLTFTFAGGGMGVRAARLDTNTNKQIITVIATQSDALCEPIRNSTIERCCYLAGGCAHEEVRGRCYQIGDSARDACEQECGGSHTRHCCRAVSAAVRTTCTGLARKPAPCDEIAGSVYTACRYPPAVTF